MKCNFRTHRQLRRKSRGVDRAKPTKMKKPRRPRFSDGRTESGSRPRRIAVFQRTLSRNRRHRHLRLRRQQRGGGRVSPPPKIFPVITTVTVLRETRPLRRWQRCRRRRARVGRPRLATTLGTATQRARPTTATTITAATTRGIPLRRPTIPRRQPGPLPPP